MESNGEQVGFNVGQQCAMTTFVLRFDGMVVVVVTMMAMKQVRR